MKLVIAEKPSVGQSIAIEAKAKIKIGKSVLYNAEKVDEYLEHFYVEE